MVKRPNRAMVEVHPFVLRPTTVGRHPHELRAALKDAGGFMSQQQGPGASEPDLVVVTLVVDGTDAERLAAVLAKYVVLSRSHPGCRNIDLTASATTPGRFVVIQKWESSSAQRAHFDSAEMVEMAEACRGLLAGPPQIDLLEPISVHDLE
jgi:quinol monooxygenase YgiN